MLYNFMDLNIRLCIVVSTWRKVEHYRFFCSSGSGPAGIVHSTDLCVRS